MSRTELGFIDPSHPYPWFLNPKGDTLSTHTEVGFSELAPEMVVDGVTFQPSSFNRSEQKAFYRVKGDPLCRKKN